MPAFLVTTTPGDPRSQAGFASPAAPPGTGAGAADAFGRWLLPLAPLLAYAQIALLDYDANWGRNRLSTAGEAVVALTAIVLLACILMHHRAWRAAAWGLAGAAALSWAGVLVLRQGAVFEQVLDAAVVLLTIPAALGLLFWCIAWPRASAICMAAVAWFAVPPALLAF